MSGCNCGSSCNCGDSCKCNKRSSGLNYVEAETAETVILGVGPAKIQFKDAEMGVAAEDSGCKCGSSCTCDPCNCK
ncbi:Metallothionein-like protein 1 [Trifolium repens]|nr:Metallothionein-like protein 1 [Trifolium repens]